MNRAFIAVAVGAAGIAGLAGCTKPSPDVTIWSPDASVARSASCWAPESGAVEAIATCISSASQGQGGDIPTLTVSGGNTLGINVDAEIAEIGWTASAGGQPLTQDSLHQTYFRLTLPGGRELPASGIILTVVASGGLGEADRGLWVFRLVSSGTV